VQVLESHEHTFDTIVGQNLVEQYPAHGCLDYTSAVMTREPAPALHVDSVVAAMKLGTEEVQAKQRRKH
jgi:hypothetical protein